MSAGAPAPYSAPRTCHVRRSAGRELELARLAKLAREETRRAIVRARRAGGAAGA